MARITIRGLSKRYQPRRGEEQGAAALLDFDLEVDDGEFLVVVGPSGCGKSTALRLIAGLEQPSGGSIRLDDRELTGVPPQERDVAMVFQGYALYPHLSVRENMAFPLKMRGMGRSERRQRVEEIAELVGLGRLLGRLPNELSGGERQRVAMGRAIVRSPKAFLFDEPLSNLDAKLRAELRVELAALVRELGTTAVYVTHDQIEAMTMGDRIAVMKSGELQQLGSPRDVYQHPVNTFVAGFLGTPAMNLLELSCDDGHGRAGGLEVPLPAALRKHDTLTLGLRPEHLRVAEPGTGELGFDAEVESVEPLGAETLAHFVAAEHSLRARLPGFVDLERGAEVTLAFAPEAAHWFDGDGLRVEPDAS
jgi:multiple sugar transport system ATP-binding protein